MKKHRIAAGGILIQDGKILLVEYNLSGIGNFLVAPGGGVEDGENIVQAIQREFKEETNVEVKPMAVLLIEDLDTIHYKMSKTWMVCEYVKGEISETEEAKKEGIISIGWYSIEDIEHRVVFPSILKDWTWENISNHKNNVVISETRKTKF